MSVVINNFNIQRIAAHKKKAQPPLGSGAGEIVQCGSACHAARNRQRVDVA
ncbi:MAG: hypothetical protein Q8R84_13040 [Candidatus Nitrotoga sp.]|nr:hypothetical protein [Candidatus Nitrotoga sp.]